MSKKSSSEARLYIVTALAGIYLFTWQMVFEPPARPAPPAAPDPPVATAAPSPKRPTVVRTPRPRRVRTRSS